MGNEGEIYSIELSATRSFQWRKEMTRTGCSIAILIRADARKLPLNHLVDVALVDPPCSNSGLFARNPASKWRVTPARLKELVRTQGDILQAASERLADGGTLVYCTCSILPEENEFVVETFLKKNPEFTLSQQTPFLGRPGLRGLYECQRFYPHLHDCNGYFIAKMQKR
jgi:16S rRNA (cytosine967-C5)-methyltransferase